VTYGLAIVAPVFCSIADTVGEFPQAANLP
jgi:hypothetical protein